MPSTVAGLMRFAAERYPDVAAVRWKEDGEWHDRSYAELARPARVALGLIALGIEPGDRVAFWPTRAPSGRTRASRSGRGRDRRADLPDQLARGVRVGGRQLRRRVAVFCEDADQLAKIAQVRERAARRSST